MRKHPCVIISIIIILCIIDSCSNRTPHKLQRAEAVMESAPDSALAILDSIDTATLTRASDRARYSLLKAMAIDKNYIDTTDLSLLLPATDYYFRKGTPDEKLRTYYYQGRIYQNRGDYDAAMEAFQNGYNISEKSSDTLTLARLLVAQALVYSEFYDFNMGADNYLKASKLYIAVGRRSEYEDCMLNALDQSNLTENKSRTDSLYEVCLKETGKNNIEREVFIPYQLSYLSLNGSENDLRSVLGNNPIFPISDGNTLLNVINCYRKIGESKKALELIEYLKKSGLDYDSLKYHSVMTSLLETDGNYYDALNEYRKYSGLLSDIHLSIFERKAQLDKERYKLELGAQKASKERASFLWGTGLIVTLLIAGLVILLLKNRNAKVQKCLAIEKEKTVLLENEKLKADQSKLELEKENLMYRISSLENERERLTESLKNNSELSVEVRNTIMQRIEMLNALFASQITADYRHENSYNKWVNELLADSEAFMNSTRLAFQASHPGFIRYLEEHDLNINEINYLCLYAIGLRGKEVGEYIKRPSHVNVSSAIRKKLGLDRHETNIGIYVRKLLKGMSGTFI